MMKKQAPYFDSKGTSEHKSYATMPKKGIIEPSYRRGTCKSGRTRRRRQQQGSMTAPGNAGPFQSFVLGAGRSFESGTGNQIFGVDREFWGGGSIIRYEDFLSRSTYNVLIVNKVTYSYGTREGGIISLSGNVSVRLKCSQFTAGDEFMFGVPFNTDPAPAGESRSYSKFPGRKIFDGRNPPADAPRYGNAYLDWTNATGIFEYSFERIEIEVLAALL